ncbi:MAG: glycosyl transferase family 1 [Steroidobacterales bacterium]
MAAHGNDVAAGPPALKLRLIGKSNGVGLSRDLELLGAALIACGCDVTSYPCERRDRKRRRSLLARLAMRASRLRGPAPHPPFDVNVMLEHIWPQFVQQARCNVLVPNPEWTDRRDLAMLNIPDRVWAKTAMAEELFGARGHRCLRIGFDSNDRLQHGIERLPQFLHIAGRSPLKGTERLVALWQRHPQWPRLTVVQDKPAQDRQTAAANIVRDGRFLSDQELRTLQNSHRFHLCLSEAEGWGHYIAEAMSVGAVTLTCDAPPMNELVAPDRGVLVGVQLGERHNLARIARFDETALEAAIERSLALGAAQLDAIGAAARRWFLLNKRGFVARVQNAVADIGRAARGVDVR